MLPTVILKLPVHLAAHPSLPKAEQAHAMCEALIEGNVYVVDYHAVCPRETFYRNNDWVPENMYDESRGYSRPMHSVLKSKEPIISNPLGIGLFV